MNGFWPGFLTGILIVVLPVWYAVARDDRRGPPGWR